jgi:serine/threonine protein kinase
MAPEQIQGKSYWKGIDIWAAGIIMYVLLMGKHPFYKREEKTRKYVGKMMNPTWNDKIKCSEYQIII